MTAILPNAFPSAAAAPARNWPALLLSLMMLVVPAIGATSEELLQDTLKSILVAFFALAAAFAYFWQLRQQERAPMHWHALLWLPLTLMAYALGSMAWAHTYLAGVEAVRWFVFSLILFLGMNTLTLARVTALAWGIHLGAVMASLWTALQFWFEFKFFAQFAPPASTFVNRNFFAEFLVCTLPFSVLLLSRMRGKTSVFLLTISIGFNIVALMMTGARSALVGLLLLMLLLPAIAGLYRKQFAGTGWHFGHRIALATLLFVTVGGLGAIHTNNPKLIEEFGRTNAIERAITRGLSMTEADEYKHGSFSVRALMWKATGRMIVAHPVTGIGAGAWEVQAPLYQEAGTQLETDFYAHNEILQLLAEYGLAGWLFLLGLLSYLVWATYRTWSNQTLEGQKEAPVRALALASLLVFLLVSNAGFPWRMASTGALFALSLSMLAASDIRLGLGGPYLQEAIPWRPRYAAWALCAAALATLLAGFIAQQAVACEAKLVHAYRLAQAISRSGRANNPRWEGTKTEILQLMREGIAINPHYRKVTPLVADELASWGDWKNAAWIWESVLASRPHIPVIAVNISRAYLEMGNPQKARDYLDRAAKLQPSAPAVRSMQAQLLMQQGQYPQAAQIISEHLDIDKIDDSFVNMAYMLGTRTLDWRLAIRALELRIQKSPSDAFEGWLHLGNIYSRVEVGNEAKALASYRAALGAAPSYLADSVWLKIPPPYQVKLRETTPQ